MNAVLRTVGGAVGTAVMGAILTGDSIKFPPQIAKLIPMQIPTLDAYKHAFWVAAALCLVAAVVPFAIRTVRPAQPVADTRAADAQQPAKTGA
jgi:hypothetical protein